MLWERRGAEAAAPSISMRAGAPCDGCCRAASPPGHQEEQGMGAGGALVQWRGRGVPYGSLEASLGDAVWQCTVYEVGRAGVGIR